MLMLEPHNPFTHTHTHTHSHIHTLTHTHTHTHPHSNTHMLTHTHTQTHIHIHTLTHTHTHSHSHTYTPTHSHTHTHTHSHAHTHTQTHTHTHSHILSHWRHNYCLLLYLLFSHLWIWDFVFLINMFFPWSNFSELRILASSFQWGVSQVLRGLRFRDICILNCDIFDGHFSSIFSS